MNLHKTVELARKFLLGLGVGMGIVILLFIFFQFGMFIRNTYFPPEIEPPTQLYGQLPSISFPQSTVTGTFSYTINTLTGTLPQFTDRLTVFPIEQPEPNLLNITKARDKAAQLDFTTLEGDPLPEIKTNEETYTWNQQDFLQRTLTMNVISFNFTYDTQYLSPDAPLGYPIRDELDTVNTVSNFLQTISLTPVDLDIQKTLTPNEEQKFTTKPQLFFIENGELVQTNLLANARVVRVDLYQQDIAYSLDIGKINSQGEKVVEQIQLPIVYPYPPYSTMSFWVASNNNKDAVVAANFSHQQIIRDISEPATYPIKTATEAFEELQAGKAYIAAFHGNTTSIAINTIYLAYYLGETPQQYLMPIIVFEGDNGFFAYVSAIKNEWIQ